MLGLLLTGLFIGPLGLAIWSAQGVGVRRAARMLANFVLLFLSIGMPVGLLIYYGLRRTDHRLARAALGMQLVGTPLMVVLMIVGGGY
jgi:hypothetical protein